MNLEEEEKKVTQEQINAKKRTERNKKNTKDWRCYILWGYLTQKLQMICK